MPETIINEKSLVPRPINSAKLYGNVKYLYKLIRFYICLLTGKFEILISKLETNFNDQNP